MRYLRYGCKPGQDVKAWEWFLRGHQYDSEIIVDETFDLATKEETARFQKSVGFTFRDVDGVVGPMTLGKAFELGFNPLETGGEDHEDGPNWPPPPEDLSRPSPTERAELFGAFKFKAAPVKGNREAIKILDNWSGENLKNIIVPQLKGIPGTPKSGTILFHKKASKQLVAMFQAWEDEGLSDLILGWAGSWVPRFIRGSRVTLSNHAWATAFDINVPWNYMGSQPALKGRKGSVRELVQIANEYGFYWGGHYKDRPDGMHFEVVKLLEV